MNDSQQSDRRRAERYSDVAGVRVHLAKAEQDFPARCRDVSATGMYMYVPAATPVKKGQTIRVAVGDVSEPTLADLAGREMPATVARVDRWALTETGRLGVGIHFTEAVV
jgi:c-di-GMP-binding flagellar brake protein YcgR